MNSNKILLLVITLLYSFASIAQSVIITPITIKSVQQQFKEHTLTSEQLVKYYLARINKYNDNGIKLNAVVQLNKNALKQAKELDNYYLKHGLKGILHGIPVLLKDNIDTIDGMANTAGSIALQHNYPKQDSFLVKKLKQAGAIILGKTNLTEWANFRSTHASSGWSGLYGQTKNPHNLTTSPCGSSAGSGAAIAANLALLAIGTETDGSITCPASINGIVGIKPTLGTISRQGIIPIAHSQDTAGPMTRTVTDAVIMLTAMVAADPKDKQAITSKINYQSHLKINGLQGKRIGIVRNLSGYLPQVDQLLEQAIIDLKKQGAVIIDNANIETLGDWDDAEYQVLLYEFKNDLNDYLATTAKGVPKSLAELIQFNKAHSQQEMPYFNQEIFELAQQKSSLNDKRYLTALHKAKSSAQKGIDDLLKKHHLDLLIAPTAQPAWKIDWVSGDHYLGSATSPAAVSGYPHITVPMGSIQDLPVGLSFFGTKLSEDLLIEAAYSYEQATQRIITPRL
ncbi:MAG: amidase [Alteromonadaceae bacterium]|nr:amidase [Alteromonadaceae bacterium]